MDRVKWARLPLSFEPELLRQDLARIRAHPWTGHFNPADFSGDWSGIALRSPSGQAGDLLAPHGSAGFAGTPVLSFAPYLREVLAALECPLKSVRLLRLRPGSAILEHTDDDLNFDLGEMRLHVPMQTNPQVEFVVDGARLDLREGECWYVDFSLPHRVSNRGSTDRIHLVIDAQVNDWARALIAAGRRDSPPLAPARSAGPWESFRELVFDDPELQARLKSADAAAVVALCVELGRERGFAFPAAEVESTLRSSENGWRNRERQA
jgi:hypothetical protein